MKITKAFTEVSGSIGLTTGGSTITIWGLDEVENKYYKMTLVIDELGDVIHSSGMSEVTFSRIRDEYTKFMDQNTAEAHRRLQGK